MLAALTVMFCLSIGASGVFRLREANVRREMAMQQQREMADVIAAMADIEVNLSKLLIASGARQSVSLLGETALLAQHVESGLSRMAVSEQTAGDAMKFAGQMGQYSLALAAQVSDGGMLTGDDERQIEDMMQACHALGQQLAGQGGEISWPDAETDSGIEYPSLIYDGPFSDGRTDCRSALLNTSRFSRQRAREAAAKYAKKHTCEFIDGAVETAVPQGVTNVKQYTDVATGLNVTGQKLAKICKFCGKVRNEGATATEIYDIDENVLSGGAIQKASGNNVPFATARAMDGDFATGFTSKSGAKMTFGLYSDVDKTATVVLKASSGYIVTKGTAWGGGEKGVHKTAKTEDMQFNKVFSTALNGKAIAVGDEVMLYGDIATGGDNYKI